LPALELSPANHTDPLVVERFPTSERIACAQDREPIFEFQMSDHNAKDSANASSAQSGPWLIV
jgi:hypothetical protein